MAELTAGELGELLGLQMPPEVGALRRCHPVPDVGAEDRDLLVGKLLGILGIEVERPVDARVAVPLPLLALLVEAQQRAPPVLENDVTGRTVPWTLAPRRAGDPAVLYASADKARAAFGWTPKFPSLDDIVRTAWAWRSAHPRGYGG